MKRSVFAFALFLTLPAATLAVNSPFERLAGQWSGNGTIQMSDGNHEPLRCKAAYDVLSKGANLQLNIRCASQNYNFDLRSSANYADNAVAPLKVQGKNASRLGDGRKPQGRAKFASKISFAP